MGGRRDARLANDAVRRSLSSEKRRLPPCGRAGRVDQSVRARGCWWARPATRNAEPAGGVSEAHRSANVRLRLARKYDSEWRRPERKRLLRSFPWRNYQRGGERGPVS